MKYIIIFLLALLIVFGCTNDSQPAAESAEVDSISAMNMSALAAEPGQTTTVTKITKQPVWFITVTNADGTIASAEVVDTDPSVPPPPPPPNNKPPLIKTGPDQNVTASTTTLNGSGSTDPDGTIVKYEWSQSKGLPAILNTVNAVCNVSGLKNGHYRFDLKITDNGGAVVSDTIHVTVSGVGSGTPPPVDPPPPPPTGSYGTLIYSNGFDKTGDLDPFGTGQLGAGTLSTTIKFSGAGSFLSRPQDVSSGTRSEVQIPDNLTPTEGVMEWYAYYEVIVPSECHSFQFHPHTSGASASPGLWHVGGKFVWNNFKGGQNTSHATGVTIQKNVWYKFRIEFKFGSSGYFNFFINDVKNAGGSWTGQVGDGSGQYAKCGLNGWNSSTKNSRIYYDQWRIWRK